MLMAILNICSKEELEEDEDDDMAALAGLPSTPKTTGAVRDDLAERRTVIKNKILAVGRMSRVFHVLREEAERVSELKMASGTGKLPYGTLVLGAEGIKDTIHNFDEARKVDIENERMPPALVEAPEVPAPVPAATPAGSSTVTTALGKVATPPSYSPSAAASPTTAMPPLEPRTPPTHRRSHSRTSSLGTTMTSPSNRRRSIETTVSMIKEALKHGTNVYSRYGSPSSSRPSSPRR